jgi:hypothetical protein
MNAAGLIIIAVAVLAMGAALGVVAVVSIGIRREERLFRQHRSFLQEQGMWLGPDGPDHFLPEQAPDGVSQGARALTGLWIRRDRGTDPQAVPWYEKQI